MPEVTPNEVLQEKIREFRKSYDCGHEPEDCNELCAAYAFSVIPSIAQAYSAAVLDEKVKQVQQKLVDSIENPKEELLEKVAYIDGYFQATSDIISILKK